MPKLYEYLGIMIFFYANEHEPIHVHGEYNGKESKAEIILLDGKVVDIVIQDVAGRAPLSANSLGIFASLLITLLTRLSKSGLSSLFTVSRFHRNASQGESDESISRESREYYSC